MKTIPLGSCFVDSFIVYKCVKDDCEHGCKDCAFAVTDEGIVCDAPNYICCSGSLRSDDEYVRFEEVGELFSINGIEV